MRAKIKPLTQDEILANKIEKLVQKYHPNYFLQHHSYFSDWESYDYFTIRLSFERKTEETYRIKTK